MSGKKILYKDEARRALITGMSVMVEAVSVTLGPKGRNVVLEKVAGSPQIINDGVSIAREIACFEKRFFPKHAVREHAEAERKHSARGARALSC